MSSSSSKSVKDDYEKASNMAKDIEALGAKNTKFFRWKMELEDIFEDLNLSEKEKKRISISTTTGKLKESCTNIYFQNKKLSFEEFTSKIEKLIDNGKSSIKNLSKLENIKISNLTVNEFNSEYSDLLHGISDRDKPSVERQIFLYTKAFKRRTPIFNILLNKQPKSLEDAMNYALKAEETINEYESDDESDFYKSKKRTNFSRRRQSNSNNSRLFENKDKNEKSKQSKEESDLEALTKSFAEMKIHVCHRCNQKGHEERYCPNEMTDLNKAIASILSLQDHLN